MIIYISRDSFKGLFTSFSRKSCDTCLHACPPNKFFGRRAGVRRFACLREAPPPEALRRAGATAKAGHAGVTREP